MSDSTIHLKAYLELPPFFVKDKSPEGLFQEKRLSQARGSLYLDFPFFGFILGQLKMTPTRDIRIKRMTVDYKYIYFNPEYTEDKNQEALKGILMHLVIHLIMQHIERSKSRSIPIWGLAAEVTTNLMVKEVKKNSNMRWEIASTTNIPSKYANINTENVYFDLLEYAEQQDNSMRMAKRKAIEGEEDKDGGSSSLQQSEDKLTFSQKTLEMTQEESGLEESCDIVESMDEINENLDSNLQELQQERFNGILQSAYSLSKDRGVLPGGLREFIEELLQPKIPWHILLDEYIQRSIMVDWRWNPPNRRHIGRGIHLPSSEKEHLEVIIAVDTSGSISSLELSEFVGEVYDIISTFASLTLTLIDCDSKVQQVTVYENGESLDGEKLPWKGRAFKGRGGTDFRPVFDYITANAMLPHLLIYFTDGYGLFPEASDVEYPVIWVMTTDIEAPFGLTLRYEN